MMVELEVRTPKLDEPTGQIEWEVRARLKVMSGEVDIEGDESLIDFSVPVVSFRTGEQVRFEDNKEEWARNLPSSYRAGDLVFAVIDDSDPPPLDARQEHVERESLRLPERVYH